MNYAELSDHQINCEVLSLIEPEVEHMQLSADQKSFFHCGYDGNGFYETVIPDYCNSWADAGPIIQNNSIGVMPFKNYESEAWQLRAGLLSNTTVKDKNPLRAAMIVFLMMQEGK